MNDADRLKLCERIIGELRCPYPANGDPADITVAGCMDRKHCGCENGVACGYKPTTAPIKAG